MILSYLRRFLLPAILVLVLLGAALGIGLLFGRYREKAARDAAKYLTVTVLDVGHGESSWIRTPTGKFILIGGGPPEAGPKIVESLRNAGAKQIDLLILPYPYAEAIGGLPDVVNAFPVTTAIEPGGPRVNQFQEAIRTQMATKHIPVQIGRAGMTIDVDGAKVAILAPSDPFVPATPTAANNSLVVRIGWGGTGFLFGGGIERAGEDSLLAHAGDDLRSDWLRVPRFGTKEACSPEFLQMVSPSFAVISVGTPNSGGYPHAETLERLQATGAHVYRTDETHSPLTFTSDSTSIAAAF